MRLPVEPPSAQGLRREQTTMWRVPPAVRQCCPNAAENASAARFQALLDVGESITTCRGLDELFRGLAVHLQRVVSFDGLGLVLLHRDRGVALARVLETSGTGFFFVQRLARPMNRQVEVVPSEALKALRRYTWPGNVRELANLVERAMILSKGRTLEIPLAELGRWQPPDHDDRAATLRAVERMHILRVLGETNWTLGGPRGAAVRLGMKRTTLQALMRRLGITRPRAA
jgi:hypothetical protein